MGIDRHVQVSRRLRMELAGVNRARRTSGLVVLEGFHAVTPAVRFGAEILGAWTADPDALENLRQRLATDVQFPVEVVAIAALKAVVPRPSGWFTGEKAACTVLG
jgi:hypothetical protein